MKKLFVFIAIFGTIFATASAQTLRSVEFCTDSTCNESYSGTIFVKLNADSSMATIKVSAGTSSMPVTSSPRTLAEGEPLQKALANIKGVSAKKVSVGYTTIVVPLEKDADWKDVASDVEDAITNTLWFNPKGGRKADGQSMH